jgi:integrase/recombinase XerC
MSQRNINEKGLVKKRGRYFRRVYINPDNTISIALETDSLSIATIRNVDVSLVESKIKMGVEYSFPWQNDTGSIKLKHKTLEEVGEKYISERRQDGIRESTLSIDDRTLRNLKSVLGGSYSVSRITQDDIYTFKTAYSEGWSPAFMNINLRGIRTFLRWCRRKGLIMIVPDIKQTRIARSLPKYLSNREYEQIQDNSSPHFKRAMHFYRETGCRLSEPLLGRLDGEFLIIEAEDYKTNREHQVQLTPELQEILLEIKEKNYTKQYYSKSFLKASRKAGVVGKSFHSLRHTYALRTYLKTENIYHVKMMLGHASVTTTEIYTNLNIRKLQQDFPDLAENYLRTHTKIPQYASQYSPGLHS